VRRRQFFCENNLLIFSSKTQILLYFSIEEVNEVHRWNDVKAGQKDTVKKICQRRQIICLLTWRKDDPSEGWSRQYPSSPGQAD
jgi:hypothetical protein